MPKVYIVVLNYQQWKDTVECITSLLDSDYHNFSVIIIDNNSPNNSKAELIRSIATLSDEFKLAFTILSKDEAAGIKNADDLSKIVFIQNDSNPGFAAGNNLALRFLQYSDSYIWLLNPDMTVKKDTLSQLVREAGRMPVNTIIGTVARSYYDKQKVLFYGGGRINFLTATVEMISNTRELEKLSYISGSSLFTHAGNFFRAGLLPEDYFLYWEETDWCYRAKKRGFKLHVCTTAECYDKISTTIGKNFLADYYYTRNGLLFISRHRKKNIPLVLFFMGFRFLKRILTGRWSKAGGVYKGVGDFLKSNYQ